MPKHPTERQRRAYIPATRDERADWTDLDYACEINDATDTGHPGQALGLLAEYRRRFL